MTRILNEKWLTKVDFSKGVIELTEWEEKIYQQGRADAIAEVTKMAKFNIRFENIAEEERFMQMCEQMQEGKSK